MNFLYLWLLTWVLAPGLEHPANQPIDDAPIVASVYADEPPGSVLWGDCGKPGCRCCKY